MEKKYMSRSKLVFMVLIYYVITSITALGLGIVQPSTGIPEVVIQLTQFGPTLGVLAVLLLFSSRQRLHMPFGLSLQPLILRRLIAMILLIVFIFGIAIIWYKITGNHLDYTDPSTLSQPFWLIIIAQFIGAAGEELGWRCFMQPMLQTKLSVLHSSIIVGLFWGIWHIGIFSEGWLYAFLFIMMAISISVILGELLRDARGNNLIIATTFHALINLVLLLFFNEESGSLLAMAVLSIACLVAAIAILLIQASLAKSSSGQTLIGGHTN
jgi:uncharacterized protein